MDKALAMLWCFILLHSPDGADIWYRSENIQEVKPAKHLQDHLAKNTRSIVYGVDSPQGVSESTETIMNMIVRCGKGTLLPSHEKNP